MLKEIRIHGRGGQGAVSLARLLALATYHDGFRVQAFPSFGIERRGAPVESYVRVSSKEINRRDHIENPDFIVIIDDTLISNKSTLNGLDKGDLVLINSTKSEDELRNVFAIYPDVKIKVIDGTSLGLDILGLPIVNTAMIGAFSILTGIASMKGVKMAIREVFEKKGEEVIRKNIELAQKAYDHFDPHKQFAVIPGEQHLVKISKS